MWAHLTPVLTTAGDREDCRLIPSVAAPSVGSHPYWAEPPTRRDLFDPRFPETPSGGVGHSAELDDIRDIIARANRRRRQQDIDEQRRRLGLF